jgi:regulator of protease activity HflC (stomatin/prohibitin superfamily)
LTLRAPLSGGGARFQAPQYRFRRAGGRIPYPRRAPHGSPPGSRRATQPLRREFGMDNPQRAAIMKGTETMKTIIHENQRGLLFRDGKFTEYLTPGKHTRHGRNVSVQLVPATGEFKPEGYELALFLKNGTLAGELAVADVADERIALHFVNGKYAGTLGSGRYAFFAVYDRHEFQIVDIRNAEVADDVPKYLFASIPRALYYKVEVAEYQKARLYFDKKLVRLLDAGTYYFWNNGTKIDAGFADTRVLTMELTGQEMLTVDKVGLRVNFVCSYRISDYVKIHTEIDDYEKQLHLLLQLALREYIGRYRLDELLENKDQLSAYVLGRLREREDAFFVRFSDAGVKDIILPGEIREIMNTVLIAEKRAQANVVTRREEVASTRSLLNTARLMDENQTLYKLKELEYLEKICDNVGTISVSGGGDLLGQLRGILRGA